MPNQKTYITKQLDAKIHQIESLLEGGFSVSEIARTMSYGYAAVYNAIKRHNLSHYVSVNNNGKSKTTKGYVKSLQKFTRDELFDLYHNKKMNLYEIADAYDISASGVFQYMKKLGIDTRSKSEANQILYEKNPELREVHRQNAYDGKTGIHRRHTRQNSWIEREFEKFCIAESIPYEKQYQIDKMDHRYDFKIYNNILVELDGEYWHNTPKQRKVDHRNESIAQSKSYVIIRFTDRQIKQTKGRCFNGLKQFNK